MKPNPLPVTITRPRRAWLAAAALFLSLGACAPVVSTETKAFRTGVDAVSDGVGGSFDLYWDLERKNAEAGVRSNFLLTRSLAPPGESRVGQNALQQRQEVIAGVRKYADLLVAVTDGSVGQALDESILATAGTLKGLDLKALNIPAPSAQELTIATTVVREFGQLLIEYRTARALPPIVAKADPIIAEITRLLADDIKTLDRMIASGTSVLYQQRLALLAKGVTDQTTRDRNVSNYLQGFVEVQDVRDQMAQTIRALGAMRQAHADLLKAVRDRDPSAEELLGRFVAEAKQAVAFYQKAKKSLSAS